MRKKTAIFGESRKVVYSEERWNLLEEKRDRAIEIMEKFEERAIPSGVYGSVARGDVNVSSDIDIFVNLRLPSYLIELLVEDFGILERKIVQATPNYAIKGDIALTDNTKISFPLVGFKDREIEFYRFGGFLNYKQLEKNERVAGVDKRLMLIVPKEYGHLEMPITDIDEIELSKIVGVSLDIIRERKRVLERRRETGRTGVFLNQLVPDHESFESYLEQIASKNPAVRKVLRERG
ncbi:putative nucleotidyltransferase [Archaeoglobus sulfaticallidus PM70-1]|uniref:protein adenylyltransferase n=1 Tax=Archaeoglobus sulfaticallidus PM70-1 TaxID=387631 RepID=N0BJA0_9EURY|nr:nucleotidyltransferase domain-containing protein [Archaeoglobus sulfaticallidus]AGK60526.1 putative nucleotidyltransferase [Archaeoglobus sulfaticallidus PM70-1]